MKARRYMTLPELAILAVLVLALGLWLMWPGSAGRVAVLERGGEEVGRYPLDRPIRTAISGANGFSLTLVVEGGAVHVEDSTCPDLICQRHAPISKTGEAIVCLPGQVSVTVEGGEHRGPDAITG